MMPQPLYEWNAPYGLPAFDQIDDDAFEAAVETAIKAHDAQIEQIAQNAEAPSFANTIEALECAGEPLNRALSVFYTVSGADSNAKRQSLERLFAPKLSAHYSSITANKPLFARIEALWERRAHLGLDEQSARLLELTRRSFLRAGAALEGDKADRMKQIKARLSELGTAFTQNLLADERDWSMPLDEAALAELPQFLASAAHAAGKESGADGPVITLSRSVIVPFLQSSPRRDLREKAYKAWAGRGANDGNTDNRAIAAEILSLRSERAELLGYASFAEYKLETEMAKTPQAVRDLLMQVWTPARKRAEQDAAELQARMQADGINDTLAPWDWRYYSEQRLKDLHQIDEAEIKPYLELDNMLAAAFDCAHRLFGLEFVQTDAKLYHPDCRIWEVKRDGTLIALFIGDYFARPSKRSGAWCSALRMQSEFPQSQIPFVINVCNFSKGAPTLLSFDDARTLFHEMGHALHQILSDVRYQSMAGTSVARDFVELPSQLFEHWLTLPEVLEKFARHSETGAAMPAELRDKIIAAGNYDMGFQTVEYVASALVDLAFHNGQAPEDPMARQDEILAEIGMPAAIGMRHATPHFAHIFSGDGYSAGYYSYMWSEVMDADAFAAFEESGSAFDVPTAKSLEAEILSRGGTADEADLYLAFRGRMPDVSALLEGRGLL